MASESDQSTIANGGYPRKVNDVSAFWLLLVTAALPVILVWRWLRRD